MSWAQPVGEVRDDGGAAATVASCTYGDEEGGARVEAGPWQHMRAFAGWPVYATIVYGRAARSMSSTPVTPGEHGPLIPRCAGTLAVGSKDLKLKKEGHRKNK